jgi:cytochrome c oxidase subunit 1
MWITAHFHLIFGGTVVIVYFGSAYALWPKLTGRRLFSRSLANVQLWTWFAGILTLTVPWHWIGLLGMPRRTAYSPYDPAIVARWRPYTPVMIAGGALLVVSAVLFVVNLVATHASRPIDEERALAFARTPEPLVSVPVLLNGFALWNGLVAVLMLLSWAYPIGQFFFLDVHPSLPWGPK